MPVRTMIINDTNIASMAKNPKIASLIPALQVLASTPKGGCSRCNRAGAQYRNAVQNARNAVSGADDGVLEQIRQHFGVDVIKIHVSGTKSGSFRVYPRDPST